MKSVVFTFGRMNPPTTGHQLLVNKLVAYARQIGAAPRVYLSHSVGAKDPLQYDKKIAFARAAFGSLVKKSNARNVIDILKSLEKEGYTHVTMFAGSDRVPEFTKLLQKYNGKEYNFEQIDVKSAGERDPDADDVSGMSASKMRALAKDDNVSQFLRGAPNTMKAAQAKNMFAAVRKALLGEDVMDCSLDEKFVFFVIESSDEEAIELPSDGEINKMIDSMDVKDFDLDDADAMMLDLLVGKEEEGEKEEVEEAVGRRWQSYYSMSQDWQHTSGSGGGTVKNRGGEEDPSTQQNIMVQLMKIIDRHGSIPMAFGDGSKMNLSSPKAQRILGKLRDLKPADREKATKDKNGFVNFVKSIHESVDIEIDEARILSGQARQKLSQRMKSMSKRLARLRQIKAKQMPAAQRLRLRARKAALMSLRRRATGKKSLDYNSLSRSQRIAVDTALVQRFGNKLGKAIDMLSKRILPKIRSKAQENVAKARDIKEGADVVYPGTNKLVPDQKKDNPLNIDATKLVPTDNDPSLNDRGAPDPKQAHLNKFRKQTSSKTVDEGRKSSADKDARDAGDTNIIYQMRKTVNSRGEHETTFADGHKAHISIADAKKLLAKFDALRLPADKHEFTIQAGQSLAKFKDVMAHGVKHEKKKISLGGRQFKEFYLGVGRSRTVSAYDNDEPPGTRRVAEGAKDEDRPEDPNKSRPLSQKMDLLLRLGLVDTDELQKFRRALRSSKKFALQSPELRMKLAELLDKLIDLTTKDPATYSRVRYNVVQKEAYALLNKAEKSGVDVDIIFEVFARGYEKNEDINEAFSRVNSFIAGGKAAQMDEDLKGACWKNYTAVGMKMKNGRKVPNCVPKEDVSPAAKKILGTVAKKHGGKVPFKSTSYKDGKKTVTHGYNDEKGNRVVTHTTNEEIVNELSKGTLSSYKSKAADSEKALTDKSSTLSVPAKDRNAAAVKANQRRQGMKLATKKIGEENVSEVSSALLHRAFQKAKKNAGWLMPGDKGKGDKAWNRAKKFRDAGMAKEKQEKAKKVNEAFSEQLSTHGATPLAKRAKRVKSFHAWHPKPMNEVQRRADVKMVKAKLPDGRIVYRRERATADVQHEMYTGSEPVSGNRADPANRFVGTNAIRQNYASVTPGQGSAAGEIAVAKFAPEKVDYSSSLIKKTRTEVDQSKENLGQKHLSDIRKALGGIREQKEINESFTAGFELAPFAKDYGIKFQSAFEHHPDVQEELDAQNEATYQGKTVPLNKPMKGDVKKSKVYVDPDGDGKAKKVNFGDKKLSIKKGIPARKKSYCARSGGQGNLTDKTKANYWSRRAWDC